MANYTLINTRLHTVVDPTDVTLVDMDDLTEGEAVGLDYENRECLAEIVADHGNNLMDHVRAVDDIWALMHQTEWSADTLSEIADIFAKYDFNRPGELPTEPN